MDVSSKVAVVTGGSCSIGFGISSILAKHGAHVVVADIRENEFEDIRREITSFGNECLTVYLDVTDPNGIRKVIGNVMAKFGRIDILVNNAGVLASPGWLNRDEITDDDWELTYKVNVRGVEWVTNAVIPYMKDRKYGKIINVASVAGRQATVINPPYAVSKAGVISLTRTMAMDLAHYNINVNAVCPALVWTPMWRELAQKWARIKPELQGLSETEIFDKMVSLRIPLNRPQTPEDIGNLVTFLASDSARNITGQTINVDGGSRTD
jgi:NAD(P)-dependent dehydrogenase (short-subunit alcohol dehydrogenase family)